MTEDYEVEFDPEKCIACGHCAWACTFDAVEVLFES
jgi:Fe-S-cluster-containing hydrogenase component 2